MVALEADESLDAPVTKHTNGHLRSFACLDPSADENLSQDPELYGDRSTQPTIPSNLKYYSTALIDFRII